MKKKKYKNISVLTLGCSKNVVDSEYLIGILKSRGFRFTENPAKADAIIVNTCGFINPAKEESINVIYQAAELKKTGRPGKVIVTGCLSKRYGEVLKGQITEVDEFLGINEFGKILDSLSADKKYDPEASRHLLTPGHYAYLKISEGCSHRCAFCAIPLIRGRHISRPMEELLKEAAGLADRGVKELNVIAQDTTFYGMDLYKKRKISELLDRLSDIEAFGRIRLLYTYPSDFPEDVLEVIATKENICNYIDIPLQHISDRILKSMRRRITGEKVRKLVEKIRLKVPHAAIRSTFITGFPGETDKDFRELYDFLKEYRLERVGVFTYSHEDNTPAYDLGDTVPENIKQERLDILMQMQQQISLEHNQSLTGKTLKVLVDGNQDGLTYGRTEYDAPDVDNQVIIRNGRDIPPGTFCDVVIDEAEEYDLYGSAADQKLR